MTDVVLKQLTLDDKYLALVWQVDKGNVGLTEVTTSEDCNKLL